MPEIFIAGDNLSPAVFTNDESRLKVRHFLAVWVADYRPLHKSNVAGYLVTGRAPAGARSGASVIQTIFLAMPIVEGARPWGRARREGRRTIQETKEHY
jgi:hypothetical protein